MKHIISIIICMVGSVSTEFILAKQSKEICHKKKQIALKKTIAVIGTGYVGLVTGAGLAHFGNHVVCADIDSKKIERLQYGEIPIYEPTLDALVQRNVALGRLIFTDKVNQAIKDADIIFIAVGTPMDEDGSADLAAVESVVRSIAKYHNGYKIIVTKSTVPIGTGKKLKALLRESGLKDSDFALVSNPEFLREGSAVQDFLEPDRLVIGSDSSEALSAMCAIYEPLVHNKTPTVFTDITSAETIKYASNAFLATKLSFINEVANLCDKTGADIKTVAYAMGLDHRISPRFLNPGPGFGGSCFPKDTQALLYTAKLLDITLHTVQAALTTNKLQQLIAVNKLQALLKRENKDDTLDKKTVAVLGLAFKAQTDDIRYSPATATIAKLLELGATVQCYDPEAMANTRREFPYITYCSSAYDAVKNADAILIMTEWDEFKQLDYKYISTLVNQKIIIDTRNILDPVELKELGFVCDMVGQSYLCKNKKSKKNMVPMHVYRMISAK